MLKKILMFLLVVSTSIGCGSTKSTFTDQGIQFDEENTLISLVDTGNEVLFSIEFQIHNHNSEEIGPFYVNFIFHDKTLSDALGYTEYSPFKILGGNENIISVESEGSYIGG